MKSMGYRRCVAIRKPCLKPAHRAARSAWARRYQHYTIPDWCRVIFTDESAMQVGGCRRTWVTRTPSEEMDVDCLAVKT
jgi:hypothetical protein